MEAVFTFGLDASRWLQSSFPQLEGFFQIISDLGREEFYLLLIPLIYWCLDKRLGKQLAYVFLLANGVNSFFKHVLRGPRPFWLDSAVGLDVEESYGVPSGHAQAASVFYLFLAGWFRKYRWVWLAALFMTLAMGVSRVYLGVHFVHDVLVGYLISIIILVGYVVWRRRFAEQFDKQILGFKLFVMFCVPLALAAVYVAVRFLIGAPDLSVAWADFVPAAEVEGVEGMATAVATLWGLGIGVVLESSRVRFRTDGPIWKRITRYLLGMVITVLIWGGLRVVFPSDPLWVAIPLRIVRYLLTLLWIAYYAPMTFVWLRLADASPEPETRVTL